MLKPSAPLQHFRFKASRIYMTLLLLIYTLAGLQVALSVDTVWTKLLFWLVLSLLFVKQRQRQPVPHAMRIQGDAVAQQVTADSAWQSLKIKPSRVTRGFVWMVPEKGSPYLFLPDHFINGEQHADFRRWCVQQSQRGSLQKNKAGDILVQ